MEENRTLTECYMRSVPPKRGYRQRIMRIWKEKGMFNVSEKRLADQVRVVLRSGWLTTIELEKIKRMTDMQETNLIEGGEARIMGLT